MVPDGCREQQGWENRERGVIADCEDLTVTLNEVSTWRVLSREWKGCPRFPLAGLRETDWVEQDRVGGAGGH